MDWELVLTVRDALKRPLFAEAELIGGRNGLNRAVRWVHVLESASLESLIHGEEMILTTGMSASTDLGAALSFMQNLIDKNAACLCIELGAYFSAIPQEMTDLSNLHDFPLIQFTRTVRFVDITLDLHSLIINRHHRMLQELESISREFHRLTLTSQGTLKVLQLLCKKHPHTDSLYAAARQTSLLPGPGARGAAPAAGLLRDLQRRDGGSSAGGRPLYLRIRPQDHRREARWGLGPDLGLYPDGL
ncbi:PucR family transcriptional regulator ligand-binding domain-containing protein [Paenibacillus rhizoplanae]